MDDYAKLSAEIEAVYGGTLAKDFAELEGDIQTARDTGSITREEYEDLMMRLQNLMNG